MGFIVPNSTERLYLENLLPDSPDYTIALFRANITPNVTDTPSTYTFAVNEATFPGYSRKNIVWPSPVTTVSNQAEVTSAPIVWQRTAGGTPENIYGYFIFFTISGTPYLIGANRFDEPIAINGTGATIDFALKAILKSVN